MCPSRSIKEVHRLHKLKEGEEAVATAPAKKQALLVYIHLICVCSNAVFGAFIAL